MEKTLDVKVGELFQIDLAENPSTGFRWNTIYDKKQFSIIKDDFTPSKKKRLGCGGERTFIFQPLKQGNYTITFEYKRFGAKQSLEKQVYKLNCK